MGHEVEADLILYAHIYAERKTTCKLEGTSIFDCFRDDRAI